MHFENKIDLLEEKYSKNKQECIILLFFVLIYVFIQFNFIGLPIWENAGFRESQTASTTRIFVSEGIDILHPKANYAGDPGYLIYEFPVYQAIVASLWNVFSLEEIWGRIVSMFFWMVAGLYLYLLVIRFSNSNLAMITLFIFLFSPTGIIYGHNFSTTSLEACISIMCVYYFYQWLHRRELVYYFVSLFLVCLGSVCKLPNFAPLVVVFIYLYLNKYKKFKSIFSPSMILFAIIPLTIALSWHHHSNNVMQLYEQSKPYSHIQLSYHYYSTFLARINPIVYARIALRTFDSVFGSVFLGVFFILGLCFVKKYLFFFTYILAYFLGILVFTGLHIPHWHYMIPFFPGIAFFGAVGSIFCWKGFHELLSKTFHNFRYKVVLINIIIIMCACLFVINTVILLDRKGSFNPSEDVKMIGDLISDYVPPNNMITLVSSHGTSPEIFYAANRRGVVKQLNCLFNKDLSNMLVENRTSYLVITKRPMMRLIDEQNFTKNNASKGPFDWAVSLSLEMNANLSNLDCLYDGIMVKIYKMKDLAD